ncbi:MAG: inorganic pyrophosphatase [Crocinitomicaceae bacterium]|nr:inorganic pyrophosphatase [Crocinitomicaceae bacterium]
MKKVNYIFLFVLVFFCLHCKRTKIKENKKGFSDDSYIGVVEIPAGTNKKFEYNHHNKLFECEIIDGKERIVNYLPYPGNYGFIKNTYMDPKLGGDGDALDVLIISESIPQGRNIKIQPLAILKLLDHGEEDHKIIAIPEKSDLIFLNDSIPESFKEIIRTWFCNYKGPDKVKFFSWGDRKSAIEEIKKWQN